MLLSHARKRLIISVSPYVFERPNIDLNNQITSIAANTVGQLIGMTTGQPAALANRFHAHNITHAKPSDRLRPKTIIPIIDITDCPTVNPDFKYFIFWSLLLFECLPYPCSPPPVFQEAGR